MSEEQDKGQLLLLARSIKDLVSPPFAFNEVASVAKELAASWDLGLIKPGPTLESVQLHVKEVWAVCDEEFKVVDVLEKAWHSGALEPFDGLIIRQTIELVILPLVAKEIWALVGAKIEG